MDFWVPFILITIFCLDGLFLGCLFYLTKAYSGYRGLLKDGILIRDPTKNLFFQSWDEKQYKELILTQKHLILRNTFFTSVINIDVNFIDKCLLRKKRTDLFKIKIIFFENNKRSSLSFKTDKGLSWEKSLRNIGIDCETL